MISFNVVQIFGDYKQILPVLSTFESFPSTSDKGYLYAFEGMTGRFKIGKTSNIFQRLQTHDVNSRSYSGSGLGKVLVTCPLEGLGAQESILKSKLQSKFEYVGSEWIIGSFNEIWSSILSLDYSGVEVQKYSWKSSLSDADEPRNLFSIEESFRNFDTLIKQKNIPAGVYSVEKLVDFLISINEGFEVLRGNEHLLLNKLIKTKSCSCQISELKFGFPEESNTFKPVEAKIKIKRIGY